MLPSTVPFWFCLLAVSAESFNSVYQGSTQKPDVPYEDSPVPKPRKLPAHISEFTDPNTGLNPFLDLEEGPTAAGRNVMKDPPFPYFEPMEGDTKDRRRNHDVLEEPHENKDHTMDRWPSFGRRIPKDEAVMEGPSAPRQSPPKIEHPLSNWPPFEDSTMDQDPVTAGQTILEISSTESELELDRLDDELLLVDGRTGGQKVEKTVTSAVTTDSVIYASVTVAVVVVLSVLFGVCWWKRRAKRTHRPVAVDSEEIKC